MRLDEDRALTGHDWMLISFCILMSFVDGFDTFSIAFAGPAMQSDLAISPSVLGSIFSAGVIGGMFGALPSAYVEMKMGRRTLLLLCIIWFSVGAILTAITTSGHVLIAVRFFAGMGLGMAVPVIQGAMTDSLPQRVSGRGFSSVLCAMPAGGMIGGFIAAETIPRFGWQSLFYIGAALPLVLLPMLYKTFPTNPATGSAANRQPDMPVGSRQMGPYRSLFREGGRALLILLATGFFSASLSYSLLSWTPAILAGKGLGIEISSMAGGILSGGAIVTMLAIGYLVDRKDPKVIAVVCYLAAAFVIVSLGYATGAAHWMLALAFLAGCFGVGTQAAVSYLLAHVVRRELRVAALSVGMIASRTGGSAGPFVIGILAQAGIGPAELFVFIACLAIIVAGCVLVYAWYGRAQASFA